MFGYIMVWFINYSLSSFAFLAFCYLLVGLRIIEAKEIRFCVPFFFKSK